MARLVPIWRALQKEVDALSFSSPVEYVYDPLAYARAPFEDYVRKYARSRGQVLLLGMNPGPYGMVQTGVPFGDVTAVRGWLAVSGPVGKPPREHPKRPVLGFDCPRSEVSGARLWGWAASRFGTPARFFERFFVANYCPLAFVEASGRNRTPDKLSAKESEPLFRACDSALEKLVEELAPTWVIGVGGFAQAAARRALGQRVRIGCILHPSPASPAANRGWASQAERQLLGLGLDLS